MRLTISARLGAVFGLATALVLATLGLFLHTQMRTDLTAAVDQGLQSRARVISGALARLGHGVIADTGGYVQPDEAFAQVIGPSGTIIDSSGNVRGFRLLGQRQLGTETQAGFLTRRLPGIDDPVRLFVTRYTRGHSSGFIVVGETLGNTNDALRQLAHRYLAGALTALTGVVLAGWLVVRAALRPVERMRAQASVISLSEASSPLAVSRVDDELSRLARTLNSMLDRLRQAHARERRFIDYASHELRTPLTALRTELDLALARPRSAPELTNAISSAGEEVDALIQLSEDLLILAAAERGRLALHRTDVQLTDITGAAADAIASKASQRRVNIAACADEAAASLDPLLVRQALANLLDNSLRHAPPGSTITVQARRRGDRVLLTVADHGPGFPQPFIGQAFEPFSRAGADAGGSGLGLAIVEAVAQAHDGTAAASNSPEGGACVTLDLAATVTGSRGQLRSANGGGGDGWSA